MKNALIFLTCASIVWACSFNSSDYQIKGATANPTMAVPVAFGDLSIINILQKKDSSHIKVDSNGLVSLLYDQELVSSDIRDLITMPNISNLNLQIAIPPKTYGPNQNDIVTTVVSSQSVDMGLSPEQLKFIAFKSGMLTYNASISPTTNLNYTVRITIPEFTDTNSNPFSQEVSGAGSLSLSGYTYQSANANHFTLKLTMIVKANSSSVTIKSGSNLNVKISFTGMDFNYIKGFFGDQTAHPPAQTIDVNAFGSSFLHGATVSFAQPKIELQVTNDYGVPLSVSFTSLGARKPDASLAMQITPSSPVAINSPATLGTSATTNVVVNNVTNLINFAPTQFYYSVSARINKGLTTGNNFMADTSKMRVKLHVEIPLYGEASNVVLLDTISVNLNNVNQTQIDSATLMVNVTNQLPLDAYIQFYLLNDNYTMIDSLLTSSQTLLVKGSDVDANGELKTASVVTEALPLQADKLSKIFQAKKIIIRAKMNTSKDANGNLVNVKFLSQYTINVNAGLKATLKLSDNF